MKRGLLLILILLCLGAVLGLWLLHDPGYVLVSWRLTSIEMSLWVAGLVWFASLVAAVFLLDLLIGLLGVNHLWERWTRSRNLERSARAFHEGSVALEQGEWRRAERLLFSAARLSSEPLPAYLAAARAAARGQDFDRAEQYLVLAEERGNRLAVGLARARLLLAAGRWEQAAALLLRLSDKYRKDDQVLMLRVEALTRLQKWGELAEILPGLQKRLGTDDPHYEALEKRVHREVLAWIAITGSRADRAFAARKLQKYWDSLPRRLRADDDLLASYASELLQVGADDEAEALLADVLERNWSNAAIEVYGRTRSTRPDQALTRALGWKDAHPHNPALMLALGRLCLQNRRWEEARHYFEAAVELRKSPEARAELIRLLSRLDTAATGQHVAEMTEPHAPRLPDLPLP
ncbi:MAG: heme biosynthesis HemY N-terminal domain-containing protein [Pedobacter sp.]|nr:heme biosynthesis HemY N-terminal domain-containing protein [Pedobacter sp.]